MELPVRGIHWEPSESHTNALIQPVKIYFISRLIIKRGLELTTNTLGSTFGKEEVGIRFPPSTSSLPQSPFNEGLSLNFFYPRFISGWRWRFHPMWSFSSSSWWEEAKSWSNIGAFRSLRSQSMLEIFLACELMRSVHNTSVTERGSLAQWAWWVVRGGCRSFGSLYVAVFRTQGASPPLGWGHVFSLVAIHFGAALVGLLSQKI